MRLFLAALLLAAGARAGAQDKCSATGTLGGKTFAMSNCAVTFYEDQRSVALWFSQADISPEELKSFQVSSFAKDTDLDGKERTMIVLGFCPGGGLADASKAAVKSISMDINHASSVLLSRSWVFDLPGDGALQVERLSGKVEPGGALSGRISGSRTSDELPYSWKIDFDVRLPEKSASAGLACGS